MTDRHIKVFQCTSDICPFFLERGCLYTGIKYYCKLTQEQRNPNVEIPETCPLLKQRIIVELENDKCKWELTDYEYCFWHTGCNNAFEFMVDGPKENHFKYCPYCGKEIELSKAKSKRKESEND